MYAVAEKMRVAVESTLPEPARLADELVYVDQNGPGCRRRRAGRSFAYYDEDNKLIRDPATLKRIRSLAIPPAYKDVWISPIPEGHIQASGRDARGRKQYRYHKLWSEMSDAAKFDRMVQFARGLPRLRELLATDLRGPGLSLRRVLATVVRLLESTLIRVGNDEYARQNQSFGLTTLDGSHVAVDGAKLRFEFKGKSGKLWRLSVSDRRIARIIRECQELPGQRLFQYVDERGARLAITSADVNAYLRELSGQEITAKDFRTWAGTWRAATALAKAPTFKTAAEAKRIVGAIIGAVAAKLGNTPTVCRKSYVHPEVVAAFLRGELDLPTVAGAERAQYELTLEEESVLTFLENVSTARPVVIAAVTRDVHRSQASK